jgi:hypothetical protein
MHRPTRTGRSYSCTEPNSAQLPTFNYLTRAAPEVPYLKPPGHTGSQPSPTSTETVHQMYVFNPVVVLAEEAYDRFASLTVSTT